jgi:hypothetical protein
MHILDREDPACLAFLADGQRTFVKRLGVGVATLISVEQSQVIEVRREAGMVGTQRSLINCQRAFVERLGVSIATLR